MFYPGQFVVATENLYPLGENVITTGTRVKVLGVSHIGGRPFYHVETSSGNVCNLVREDLLADYQESSQQITMLTGRVASANLKYKQKTYIQPVEYHYSDGSIKYSCPICDALQNKHSIPEGSSNCPLCNVNLTWEEE